MRAWHDLPLMCGDTSAGCHNTLATRGASELRWGAGCPNDCANATHPMPPAVDGLGCGLSLKGPVTGSRDTPSTLLGCMLAPAGTATSIQVNLTAARTHRSSAGVHSSSGMYLGSRRMY